MQPKAYQVKCLSCSTRPELNGILGELGLFKDLRLVVFSPKGEENSFLLHPNSVMEKDKIIQVDSGSVWTFESLD